jgi:hypothetical protein
MLPTHNVLSALKFVLAFSGRIHTPLNVRVPPSYSVSSRETSWRWVTSRSTGGVDMVQKRTVRATVGNLTPTDEPSSLR